MQKLKEVLTQCLTYGFGLAFWLLVGSWLWQSCTSSGNSGTQSEEEAVAKFECQLLRQYQKWREYDLHGCSRF